MVKEKITRREFLERTAIGTAAVATGIGAIDSLLSSDHAQAAPVVSGSSNAKDAGSVISLPKGGGAIKGIGETFKPNPFTGTANFTVPIATSPGRGGFGPELSLQYSSGNGNGPFGLGWALSVPMVSRKTEDGIPQYNDEDTYLLSGAEDLVARTEEQLPWRPHEVPGSDYDVTTYRPRVEGLFAKIERWKRARGTPDPALNDIFWKITTKENITSVYGLTRNASLHNPDERINKQDNVYQWFIELTYDEKGNYVRYQYKGDQAEDILAAAPIFESHRRSNVTYQRYIKSIHYGNHQQFLPASMSDIISLLKTEPTSAQHFFMVVFDYGEHGERENDGHRKIADQVIISNMHEEKNSRGDGQRWDRRPDPFSFYRTGFEIRTYRRCQRVLMFHTMPGETTPTLVRSTDFRYEALPFSLFSILKSVTQRGYRKLKTARSATQPILSEEFDFRQENDEIQGAKSRYYSIKSIPPLEFAYSQFEPKKQKFKPFTGIDGDMPPAGLNDPNFTLVDITKTGLPDVLQTAPTGYYYWENLGEGVFDRRRQLENHPAGVLLEQPGVGFGDMAGDGTADLLVHTGAHWGFYESDSKGGWKQAHFYDTFPSFSLEDPNVRLLDLTGDSRSDVLRTDDRAFVWFRCEGEDGFGEPRYVMRQHDLQDFPDVYFGDPRVQIADLTGDGLNDIVFVHSGRIDYWPNLGYGRFGKRVTMANAPHFGFDFDPRRLFFIDIDGSGPADMMYVESGKVRFWFNQSGNRWSDGQEIEGTPAITNYDAIQIADMFGYGCSGVLWSTNYRGAGRPHYMFLDFTGGVKPNVLLEMNNNMGTTTKARYRPSTYFYLEDRKQRPTRAWISTLPFPVQCLEKVELIDHISQTKLVTQYAYHHGFYDGKEREFRGFAFVEQVDTEHFEQFREQDLHEGVAFDNGAEAFHVPPVLTKTWFHTGAYELADITADLYADAVNGHSTSLAVRDRFGNEYYNKDAAATRLPNTVIQRGDGRQIDVVSLSEAYRALRGQILRQEVYALDRDKPESVHPYSVTESNAVVRLEQARGNNKHAVYFVHPHESVTYHYERNPLDPRLVFQFALKVDNYGNVERSCEVFHKRRASQQRPEFEYEQNQTRATAKSVNYINSVDSFYLLGVPYEEQTFEIGGIDFTETDKNRFTKVEAAVEAALQQKNKFHEPLLARENKARLLAWQRHYFWKQDQSGELPLGQISSRALKHHTTDAVFPEAQISVAFGTNVTDAMLSNEGKYQKDLEYWWNPGIRQEYEVNNFFLPCKTIDAFGAITTVWYDSENLIPNRVVDALQNETKAKIIDYYTLQPQHVIDLNGNSSEVSYDPLGLVYLTSVYGKEFDPATGSKADKGDQSITSREYGENQPQSLKNVYDSPHDYLQQATSFFFYDLFIWLREHKRDRNVNHPACVLSVVRETHISELPAGQNSKLQFQITYFDGSGRELQKKIKVEPGKARSLDATRHVVEAHASDRWLASGRTVYNNKGKPVKQYEPFYSPKYSYEPEREVTEYGVSSVLFYDPVERVVATMHPNHTYEKVVFDPWRQITYDVNDTVSPHKSGDPPFDPKNDPDVGHHFRRLRDTEYLPTWYDVRTDASKALLMWPDTDAQGHSVPNNAKRRAIERSTAEKVIVHADTPTVAHFDSLGRAVLTVAHNKFDRKKNDGSIEIIDEKYPTRVKMDIQGNQREVIDAKDRIVMRYDYDMLGNRIHQASMEAGERWTLNEVTGKPIRAWDSRGFKREMSYDALRRPTELFVTDRAGKRWLAEHMVYGETQGSTENLRGHVYQAFDAAGIVTNKPYDFKGNLLQSKRQLVVDYRNPPDWGATPRPNCETETFISRTWYDALNRPIQIVAPYSDRAGSTVPVSVNAIRPGYNEASLLQRMDVWLEQSSEPSGLLNPATTPPSGHGIKNIEYNAKGQRTKIEYKNDATTTYDYEAETFRLIRLHTSRPAGLNGLSSQLFVNSAIVQDLYYAYDPAGNITYIADLALKSLTYNGENVEPICNYRYDAIYRLIEASGREHIGQTAFDLNPLDGNRRDYPFLGTRAHPNDPQVMRNYTERYEYDAVGNFQFMRHIATGGSWTRSYDYDEHSLIEPATKKSNRLTRTRIGNGMSFTETYGYTDHDNVDVHGCMTSINAMKMIWNFKDQLQEVNLGGGGTAYYVYDLSGQRVRKVWEKSTTLIDERIYLGGFEVFRRQQGADRLERETLHIMDDKQRIALVETRTLDTSGSDPTPRQLIRYQFGNHLGSASLELDDQAQIISYEEYSPYGSTTFQAVRSQTETTKRYRYTGKERDEESGLYYHEARYYAVWLGKWSCCDPAGLTQFTNLYVFVGCNPITRLDPTGLVDESFLDLRPTVDEVNAAGLDIGVTRPSGTRLDVLLPDPDPRVESPPADPRMEADKGARRGRRAANSPKQNPPVKDFAGKQVQLGKPQPGDEMSHMFAARNVKDTGIPNDIVNAKKNILAAPATGQQATVVEQMGGTHRTDVHAATEPKIDEIAARNLKGKTPMTPGSSAAAQRALEEAKLTLEPMTRRYSDTVKARGPAAPEPGPAVDPKTGIVKGSATRGGYGGAILFLLPLVLDAFTNELQRIMTRKEMEETDEAFERLKIHGSSAVSIERDPDCKPAYIDPAMVPWWMSQPEVEMWQDIYCRK